MARDQACVFIRESYGLRSFCFGTAQMDKLYYVMRNDEAWHPLETANNSFHGFRWLKCKHFSWNGDGSTWFTCKMDHYNTEFEAKRRPKSAQASVAKVQPLVPKHSQRLRRLNRLGLRDALGCCPSHVTTRIASIFWYKISGNHSFSIVIAFGNIPSDALSMMLCDLWCAGTQISKQPVTTVAQNEESLLKQILLI